MSQQTLWNKITFVWLEKNTKSETRKFIVIVHMQSFELKNRF